MDRITREKGNRKIKYKIIPETKTVIGEMYRSSLMNEVRQSCSDVEELIVMNASDTCAIELCVPSAKVRAKAVCKYPDEFDPEIGMAIVEAKLIERDHEWKSNELFRISKVLGNLSEKLNKMEDRHYRKAYSIRQDLWRHYNGGRREE